MAATATRMRICDRPISTFVPKISINTSAQFGACITKGNIGLICYSKFIIVRLELNLVLTNIA